MPLGQSTRNALIPIALLAVMLALPAPARADSEASADDPRLDHWSYQPVADPAPPPVNDAAWPASHLDRFILSRLEAAGLAPAPQADKRTLIRRATFDLTGLPPTPAEIDAFLADDSPHAFARVVDRLLASPHYGERWARHWLDVARYADSNGLDENIAHGTAWRYRDWVIDAFNRDMPFDEFVRMQIAGDLMGKGQGPRAEGRGRDSDPSALSSDSDPSAPGPPPLALRNALTATAFLSLGPKVLAEVDETKMELDIIDEQVDTLGRALLASTLGCARCHDHKFDPISMHDYYALAGIFKSTRTMEHFTKIARWWENPIPTEEDLEKQAEHAAQLAALKQQMQELTEQANAALLAKLGPEAKLPEKPETKYDEATRKKLTELHEAHAKLAKAPPAVTTVMGVTEGKPVDLALHWRGSHLTLGEKVERAFPAAMTLGDAPAIPGDASGRLELARWLTSPDHPLTARVIVNRVWRWHFGEGLVRTPDNFGLLGDKPTHPQLLDWLTSRFIEDGWSIQSLHRRIMLSRTWQMSSRHDARAAELDPTNRLRWRFDVRRLEAEAIRDGMLAVAGRLDRTMGGPVLHVGNREFLFDHTSKDTTTYDSTRRSVYLPVIRNHVYDALALHDFPDSAVPQGDRPTTTVAPQALFAMNATLVWESAGALAERAMGAASDDEARVRWLYERVFGREAGGAEVEAGVQFVSGFVSAADTDEPRETLAWQSLCQVLLSSNEFVYLR